MNADFVCIKVDREERPDLDAVYMNATVAMTGQGGWPMTCFLTPDGGPFFCGTYYPKPNFLQLLAAVSRHLAQPARRGRAGLRPDHRRAAVDGRPGCPAAGPQVQPALCDHAVAAVLRDEDTHAAVRLARRSSRRRRCWRRCCAATSAPATSRRWRRSNAPARRWRAAASTTSSPADSPATASTPPGWCRTSRRCSTTTRCCCGPTRTGRGAPETRWRAGSPTRRPRFMHRRSGRRRHVHLVAGRRRRRRGGSDLRVDARPAGRGAR